MNPTILLTSPTAGLDAVLAKAHGPFGIAARHNGEMSIDSKEPHMNTYTVPWSVVGGASRSGFCWSIATFCGPSMFAPKLPRMGATSSSVPTSHIIALALSDAYGMVGVALAADSAVEAGAAATKPESSTAQTTDVRKRDILRALGGREGEGRRGSHRLPAVDTPRTRWLYIKESLGHDQE